MYLLMCLLITCRVAELEAASKEGKASTSVAHAAAVAQMREQGLAEQRRLLREIEGLKYQLGVSRKNAAGFRAETESLREEVAQLEEQAAAAQALAEYERGQVRPGTAMHAQSHSSIDVGGVPVEHLPVAVRAEGRVGRQAPRGLTGGSQGGGQGTRLFACGVTACTRPAIASLAAPEGGAAGPRRPRAGLPSRAGDAQGRQQ